MTHNVALSPFDQTIPRLYVHKLFCFPFPNPDQQAEAVENLEQALSATISRWPFITGSVSPTETAAQYNAVQLRYNTPAPGEIGKDLLTIKTLATSEFPWTYEQLCGAGVPPSAFDKGVLSIVPEWPKPDQTYPALAIQANFIEGGLILCFGFHHAVADGSSFCTFLKAFAAATKNPQVSDAGTVMPVDKRLSYALNAECDVPALNSFAEYNSTNAPVRPKASEEVTTRIFTFSATTVQKLEETIKEHLKKNPTGATFVSNIACLSSLIWVAVVRARRSRLSLAETTKIGIAVNARSFMEPRLPEEYFGNVVVHMNATAKVHELLHDRDSPLEDEATDSSISTATLALAASRMRQATQNVDSKYVSERLKTFSALADPTETSRAYTRAMDTSNTGLDFSSWRDQGADVEFAIPGTGTLAVHYWRKAWSPNEGAYNILPRKGGSKGTADWEVSLGLSVEDMERVCLGGELGAWAKTIVE